MSASGFRYLHRVTYAECTLGDHVYYARYLELLEAARGEFFRELGSPCLYWQERDVIFPVVECRLRYKSTARYDDQLTIELWLTLLEKVRLNFAYRIANQANVLILEAETFHVCAGLSEKLKRLPEELKEKLRPYSRKSTADLQLAETRHCRLQVGGTHINQSPPRWHRPFHACRFCGRLILLD